MADLKKIAKRTKMDRPTWGEYFMYMAILASKRSSCLRRKVGAVAVRDKRQLATGYNGAPSRTKSCLDIGYCERQRQNVPSGQRVELCRAMHAEQNVVAQAAYNNASLKGATLFITNYPCSTCAKLLINAGIKQIFYLSGYDDPLAKTILAEAKVKISKMPVRGITLGNEAFVEPSAYK